MNTIIEKIKSLDKKTQIILGSGIGLIVVISIFAAIVLFGGGESPKDKDTEKNSEYGTQLGTEDFGTENESTTEVLGTELETEVGTEISSESETTEVEDGGQEGTGNNDGQEVLGAGSAAEPYMVIPDVSDMTVTTVTIPANTKVYYSIQRVGGMWLSIEDSDAYVIEADGTRHDAKSGKVGFTVESAMASEYITLQIGNKGTTAKSLTIKFSNVKGSSQNPEVIAKAGQFTKHLSAGNEVGYYYKYIAEKKSAIRFYIISESTKCNISVTNNKNSANRTFEAEVQEDEKGRYVELEADFVEKGDEIVIILSAQKYRGSIPAADVTWEIVYVD